jgi:putative ABC transport system permease protein
VTARLLRELARVARRNRGLTIIMVAGLSAGITLWELSSITWRQQRRDAIGEAPSLFALALRRDSAGAESFPQDPRLRVMFDTFLAPRDAAAMARPDYATRIVTTSPGMLAATPGDRPAEELPVRFASAGVFEMFALRFRFGGPYRDGDQEIVLDHPTNQRWFAGADSVGRTVRIGARSFRVAGVLAPERWMRPYDAFVPRVEGIFLPMEMLRALRAWPDAMMATAAPSAMFTDWEHAEDTFLRVWVEVPPASRDAYDRELMAYVRGSPARKPRLVSARLLPWSEWRTITVRADPVYDIFRVLGILILAGCTLNLVRIATVLFGSRAAELGVRRALGESRRAVLARQVREAVFVGACAGVTSVLLLVGFVPLFNAIIPTRPLTFFLDGHAIAACLLGGPVAAVLASLHPAWRFSHLPPAALLRRQ